MDKNIHEIDFKSKECKNQNHPSCSYQWGGFGFVINCDCQCHNKKTVLGNDILYLDSSNGKNVTAELKIIGESNT